MLRRSRVGEVIVDFVQWNGCNVTDPLRVLTVHIFVVPPVNTGEEHGEYNRILSRKVDGTFLGPLEILMSKYNHEAHTQYYTQVK